MRAIDRHSADHTTKTPEQAGGADLPDLWEAVRAARGWLDEHNGCDPHELTCRILKVTEEAGEAAGAWIGMLGQNPRKGVTASREDAAAELADVVFTALVAIDSLGLPTQHVVETCARKVLTRIASAAG